MLKLADPDSVVECPNNSCKTQYEWDYEQLNYYIKDTQLQAAKTLEFTSKLGSAEVEHTEQLFYCCKCNTLIGLTNTEDFEHGRAYLYLNVRE